VVTQSIGRPGASLRPYGFTSPLSSSRSMVVCASETPRMGVVQNLPFLGYTGRVETARL